MTVKLIIPIECDEHNCNSSVFNVCRFVARNTGAPFNYYCSLFNTELSSDFKFSDKCSYKEFQRCKECKDSILRGGYIL